MSAIKSVNLLKLNELTLNLYLPLSKNQFSDSHLWEIANTLNKIEILKYFRLSIKLDANITYENLGIFDYLENIPFTAKIMK
jgi:hypothetical protein